MPAVETVIDDAVEPVDQRWLAPGYSACSVIVCPSHKVVSLPSVGKKICVAVVEPVVLH